MTRAELLSRGIIIDNSEYYQLFSDFKYFLKIDHKKIIYKGSKYMNGSLYQPTDEFTDWIEKNFGNNDYTKNFYWFWEHNDFYAYVFTNDKELLTLFALKFK